MEQPPDVYYTFKKQDEKLNIIDEEYFTFYYDSNDLFQKKDIDQVYIKVKDYKGIQGFITDCEFALKPDKVYFNFSLYYPDNQPWAPSWTVYLNIEKSGKYSLETENPLL